MSRPSVDFRATVRTRGPSQQIDEAIVAKRDELKRQRPEIDEIKTQAESKDRDEKVGAGYEAKLTGTIFFKPGTQPNWLEVERAGQECFDHDFKVLPMFVLDTTNKDATAAPIHCRKCRAKIGEVPDYLRLVTSGNEAQIGIIARNAAAEHLNTVHADIDPATVVF